MNKRKRKRDLFLKLLTIYCILQKCFWNGLSVREIYSDFIVKWTGNEQMFIICGATVLPVSFSGGL
jgi:hypothetical protein